jgi:EamA domain-containing membrane protein RarD
MTASSGNILIAIAALAVIAVFLFLVKTKQKPNKLFPLAAISLVFVVAGILFGEQQWIGYSLLSIGVVMAMVDMIKKYRKESDE